MTVVGSSATTRRPSTSVRKISFSASSASASAPATVSALMLYAWPGVVGADRRHHRDQALGEEPLEDGRVDHRHVADEAEVDVPRRRRDQPGVLAGEADRQRPVHVDGGDDVAVDLADEHHAGDVEGVRVGDPQPVAELGLLAEPRHELADLRAAAVDDDRQHPDGAHEHDVLGEGGEGVHVALSPSDACSALPPYLTTTILPRKRWMYGSASTSTDAVFVASARSARVTFGERRPWAWPAWCS